MSKKAWHEFLAAEGVSDWVILHGGGDCRIPCYIAKQGSTIS